jgi:subtilisin family serine protease
LTGPLAFSAAGAASPVTRASTPHSTHTVTLITGDKVVVTDVGGGRQTVDVQRPRGATGGVRTETIGKDLYVFPDEVMPYMAAAELDRRLFDVTVLISDGYDDQHSDGIPMIFTYAGKAPAPANAQIAPQGITQVRALPSINGKAVRLNKANARGMWTSLTRRASKTMGPATAAIGAITGKPQLNDGLAKVWLDGKVHADLAESTAQIGAPAAWAAGFDGTGVKVAVLDTGADLEHPDLAGRVSLAVSFVPGEDANDGHGHGTHTLSTVGGSGAASGGLEKGVAPGANLLVGKVLDNSGSGDDSWVIAGMQWAAAQGARVISMSLGGTDPSDGTDPMSLAVDQLSAQTGALFVIAAGNTGAEASMSAPGTANSALTVAAVDANDQLAYFSTMGPRFGDYGLKPDIAAPGVDILAALAGGSADIGYYQTMSGTSMATPHVAGAAAILAQEHPDWDGQQLKDALMSTSKPLPDYTAYQVGAGRVDIAHAITDTITATGSAYFGFDAWPYSNEAPVARTVTYRNSGAATVTLNLSETVDIEGGPYDVDPTADAGTPAPPGMFTLSANSVTVPAHGSASVTATAMPNLAADGRRYLGQITASNAADVVARTDVGLYKEDQRYTLHVSLKDRSGNPASGFIELQEFGVIDPAFITVGDSGELDLRLPGGVYSAVTYLDVPGSHGQDSLGMAMLGNPQISLDHDQDLTLDARKAVEVRAEVPRKTEDRMLFLDWYRSDGADSTIAEQYLLPSAYDSMYALPTQKVTKGSFEFESRWRKAYPMLLVTDRGKPVSFLALAGSAQYSGTHTLATVYAGAGAPTDYAKLDVKGKAVIVTRTDALTGSQRAQAAADAGAKLLVVANDRPGKLMDWVGQDDGSYSVVPVVSVTTLTGGTLIDEARSGTLKLALAGVPNSPYAYDLVDPHPNQIPTHLTYRPTAGQLATVTTRFYGTTRYASGEFRWDYRPYRQFSAGYLLRVDMPGTRTDYVSTQPGDGWADAAVTGPTMELVSSSEIRSFRAGSHVTSDWFAPIARPRDGGGFWSSQRDSLSIQFNVQPWADSGADHAGYLVQDDKLKFKVYQDGQLIKESDWASASLYPIPTVPTKYTLDLRATRDPSIWRLSPSTHTVWTVMSNPVTDPYKVELMPLLQLDYHIHTDLAGNAVAGWQTIGMTASHLPGASGTGKIVGGTLSVSYDNGVTWHKVPFVKNSAGNWTGKFKTPTHGYVSIRAAAWDSVGNRISQKVVRAFGLK